MNRREQPTNPVDKTKNAKKKNKWSLRYKWKGKKIQAGGLNDRQESDSRRAEWQS